jgi:cobalt/nickel transport system permease protein
MTHMHIPDGILPVWLWVSGFLAMAAVLAFCLYRLRGMDRKKKIPLLGAVSAVMLVAMSFFEVPLYHLNLSVVAGILLGPSLGFLAAFIVNLMLALMGHGGITVMGLNTILLGTEAVLGHTLFFLLPARLPVFWRAATATVLALCVASLFLIAIVGVSHIDVSLMEEGHEHGVASVVSLSAGRGPLLTFAVTVLIVGFFGWIIEGAITGAIIRFIAQVKPDLLAHVLHKESCHPGAQRCAP